MFSTRTWFHIVIFNLCNVPHHIRTGYVLAVSISGTEGLQLFEGCWCWLLDKFSRLHQSFDWRLSLHFPNESWYFQSSPYMSLWSMCLLSRYCWLFKLACAWKLGYSCTNECLDVFSNIHEIWKIKVLQKSWEKFSWGSNARVDESLVERESAATSLLQRIGRVHSRCTFNTSCVDQVALMSTFWALLCWQCSLWSHFCFRKTFVIPFTTLIMSPWLY